MVELDKGDPEYQEITFNEVSEAFTHEELEGKDLILIRAPAEVFIFTTTFSFLATKKFNKQNFNKNFEDYFLNYFFVRLDL